MNDFEGCTRDPSRIDIGADCPIMTGCGDGAGCGTKTSSGGLTAVGVADTSTSCATIVSFVAMSISKLEKRSNKFWKEKSQYLKYIRTECYVVTR